MTNIIDSIYLESPYKNFDASKYKLDLQTWTNNDPVYKKTIRELKPSIIIEVGVWKGGTSIKWAQFVKEFKLNTKIICVDTFLGSSPHWTRRGQEFLDLNLKNGYPTLYYQFLANVVHSKCQDIIIPIPNTSIAAYEILKKVEIMADLIFIDAGHDYDSCYLDIKYFLDLLNINGKMFGHDWNTPSVKKAVAQFENRDDIKISEHNEVVWLIEKIK